VSLAEIERFAAGLKSNAALRAEAKKSQGDKSQTPMDRAVAFASGRTTASPPTI
jgi:hypothetical protein